MEKEQENENEMPALEDDAMRRLERIDEEAIEADLKGKTVFEDLFYVEKDGKPRLTWKGVKELRNEMREQGRPISVMDTQVHVEHYHGSEYGAPPVADFPCTKWCEYVGNGTAKLMPTGERNPATASQRVLMEVYDRDKNGKRLETFHYEVDPFGRGKCESKTQRNAIRAFIPELVVTKAAEKWLEQKRPAQKFGGHSQAVPKQEAASPASPANGKVDLEYMKGFSWYTREEKNGKISNKAWKEGDDWGFANATGFGGDELLEIAKPVVRAIAENNGALVLGNEIFSYEDSHGQLMRKTIA